MLLPVFDDEDGASVRRWPWVCLALAALWVGTRAATLAGLVLAPERWGLLPDAVALPGLLSYAVLHVHTTHLAVSLALLLLAAVPLECRWGSLFTAALWLLLVPLCGAVYALTTNGSDRPLVGPSAALAGIAAASIVRFFRGGLPFELAWPRGGRRIAVPALVVAAVWFVGEVVLDVLSDVAGPTRGLHYGAHAAAAVVGVACALGIRRTGLEERWLRPGRSAARDAGVALALERARAAREEGHADEAFDLLTGASTGSPREPRLVAALWELACASGRRDEVRPAALRFVGEAWQRGDREAAGAVWRAVVDEEPGAPLDLRLRLGLAPALHEAGHRQAAARTLHGALGDGRPLTPGAALRIADLARRIHPPTGIEAARRALAVDGLDETKRARIAALIESLATEPANLEELDLEAAPTSPPEQTALELEAEPGEAAPDLAGPRSGPAPGAARLEPDGAPEDPNALALDPGAEAEDSLELAADGSLAPAAEETPFGTVDLDLASEPGTPETNEPPPEPRPAPPLASAGPPPPPAAAAGPGAPAAARPLPALDPDAESPGGAAEAEQGPIALGDPDPDDLNLDDLDLEALGDLESLIEPADLAGPPEPRFAAAKVIEAVPRALRQGVLEVAAEGGGSSRLPLARVEAVSVVGVRDLGPEPVILIDLLFNWTAEDGGPIKIARLRSDRFDPAALARAGSPLDAVRALATALLECSGGRALPDTEAARGRPFAIHDTLAGYEREVLLVGSD